MRALDRKLYRLRNPARCLERLHEGIGEVAGVRFQCHGLCNAFIMVAERELLLPPPRSLTKALVSHAWPSDVTERNAVDRTVEQLRGSAQRVVDRIDELCKWQAHHCRALSITLCKC